MEETTLKQIFEFSIIGDRVKELKRHLQSSPERIVPWIGAGISAAAGLPLWSSFLSHMSRHLDSDNRDVAEKLISKGMLDLAADFICNFSEVNIQREIVDSFGKRVSGRSIPHPIRKLGSQTLVTTNYDRLIEISLPWLVPLTPQSYRTEALRKGPCLLKLHGTVEQPESWILTRWQYAHHYNSELIEDLREIFRNRIVLFLGCSLRRDQYLEILKALPKHERGQHFAVLCVDSDEEGRERGEALLETGIEVIPYRTTGRHALIQEILDYIQPSAEQSMAGVRSALDRKDTNQAVALLRPWLDDTEDTVSSKSVADTTAQAVERLRVEGRETNLSLLDELARAAIDLDPTSAYALRVYAEFRESQGFDATVERTRLAEILNRESAETSRLYTKTDNRSLREAYKAFRLCDHRGFEEHFKVLLRNPQAGFHTVPDRLRLFELRLRLSGLTPWAALSEAQRLIPEVSGQALPLAEAMIFYHIGRYEDAIASLNALDRRWRGASNGKGLGFSLHLRAVCLLAQRSYLQALNEIDRCHVAYVEPQKRLIRKFHNSKSIPGELSYDLRALGSAELYSLVDFWRLLIEINVRPNQINTSRIERVYERLEALSEGDRLLEIYQALVLTIHPGADRIMSSGMVEVEINRLMEKAQKHWPGLLRDSHIAAKAILCSGLAPKWFENIAISRDDYFVQFTEE